MYSKYIRIISLLIFTIIFILPIILLASYSPNISSNIILSTGLTVGNVYYQGSSGLDLSKADSVSTLRGICLAISSTQCQVSGTYTYASTQGWTKNDVLYISDIDAGSLVNVAPTTSGHFIQAFGIAQDIGTILIMPSIDVGTIQ